MSKSEPPSFSLSRHDDGYIEAVLEGEQTPDQILEMVDKTREILGEHGPSSLFIDARRGRIGRDASSFSVIMRIARDQNLRGLIVLVDRIPTNPNAGKMSGVIISMLTAALGKRPSYIYDEAEARQAAAKRVDKDDLFT